MKNMNPPPTCTLDWCDRPYLAIGFCSLHWTRNKNGTPLDAPVQDKRHGTPDERFDRKWVLNPNTGCHVWTDHLNRGGYGQFRVKKGFQMSSHKYAYERKYGKVPDDKVLDHTCHPDDGSCPGGECEHRKCCNPDHLEVTTRGENTLRSATGITALNSKKTHCPHGHPYTEYIPGSSRGCTCAKRIRKLASRNS